LYIPKSPIMLCIGLTTKCNLNCRHCSADANSENVFFPHSELITIIDTAKELGVKKLIFGGGEPLLYEQLFDVCEYALAKGFKVSFVTNGTLVSEVIERFSKILDYRHSFEVGVSLDGHTPEIHGYFRPQPNILILVPGFCRLDPHIRLYRCLCSRPFPAFF
jgi:MoaA/NifB/PqqE/SkfB family radical SAM enzyme